MSQKILSAILMVAVLSTAVVANAQRQVGSYMPANPTLSPYLYLTRPNAGPFPNYQTFVEPIRNQTQINNMQQANIDTIQQTQQLQLQQTQQTQLQQTQPQSLQQQQMKILPAQVAPTGIGAGYNNMSHYYGGGSSQGASGGSHARGSKSSGSSASGRGG